MRLVAVRRLGTITASNPPCHAHLRGQFAAPDRGARGSAPLHRALCVECVPASLGVSAWLRCCGGRHRLVWDGVCRSFIWWNDHSVPIRIVRCLRVTLSIVEVVSFTSLIVDLERSQYVYSTVYINDSLLYSMPAMKDDLCSIERRLDALLTGSWFLGTPSCQDFKTDFMKQEVSWDDTKNFFLRLQVLLSQVMFYYGEGGEVAEHMNKISISEEKGNLFLINVDKNIQYVLCEKAAKAHSTFYSKKTPQSKWETPSVCGSGPMTSVGDLNMAFKHLFGSLTHNGKAIDAEDLGKDLLKKCFP